MTKYDFTTLPNRLTHHTYKWKETETDPEIIPAWIADMDFNVIPEVREAVIGYADQMVYGYTYASDSLYQSILDWEKEEHGYSFDKEAIVFIEGVVPAISTAIQAFTKEGDAVLINTPVYPPFARSVKLNRRKLIENSLVEKDGLFQIDFDQLEKDIVEQDVKLYVLCNPHNPGGRVWDREVLEKIGHLCQKHGVLLVSDEIHQDLALYGHRHTSFNTVDPSFKDFSFILTSATKTFNIAGLQVSNIFIPNDSLRRRFIKEIDRAGYSQLNTMGIVGCEGAYKVGAPWLDELKEYIQDNIQFTIDYVAKYMPKIHVYRPEGTYLMWLDCSKLPLSPKERDEWIINDAKLWLDTGSMFGVDGEDFERINVACPRKILEEGLEAWRRAYEAKGF